LLTTTKHIHYLKEHKRIKAFASLSREAMVPPRTLTLPAGATTRPRSFEHHVNNKKQNK